MSDTRAQRALMQPSSSSSSSSEDDDDVLPPSMHESLRDGLEDDEDSDGDLKRHIDASHNDSQATLLEDVSLLSQEQDHQLNKGQQHEDGSKETTRKGKRARSNTGTPKPKQHHHLELKLEQSNLRKRRRRRRHSSSKRSKVPQIERVNNDNNEARA